MARTAKKVEQEPVAKSKALAKKSVIDKVEVDKAEIVDLRQYRRNVSQFLNKRIETAEKNTNMVANTSRYLDPQSTGSLCVDWLFNGGIYNTFAIVSGFEGTAKCVTGSTIVNTNEGFVHFNEFIRKDGLHETSKYSIVSHQGFDPISHLFRERAETLRVTTHEGFSIEGTHEHPMMVLSPELDFVWKRLDQIVEGDWIVSSSENVDPVFGTDTSVSKNMATIMGYLTANGRYASLNTGDADVRKRFKRAVIAETGKPPTKVSNGHSPRYDILGSGKQGPVATRWKFFDAVLTPLGYTSRSSKEKCIPVSVRKAPKEILHEFLEAYFECDSGVDAGRIKLVTASKKLAHQLHILLAQIYGIRGSLSSGWASAKNSKNPVQRRYWNITLMGRDAVTFLDTFKRAKVQKYAGRFYRQKAGSTSKSRLVPYVRGLTIEAYAKCKVGTSPYSTMYTATDGEILRNFWKPDYINASHSGQGSNIHASEFLFYSTVWEKFLPNLERIAPELSVKLAKLVASGCNFERVVSIRRSKKTKYVYDVTVPKTRAFVANNLVSHNTTLTNNLIASGLNSTFLFSAMVDAEGTMNEGYFSTMLRRVGINYADLEKDPNKPFRYYKESVIEPVFDYMVDLLTGLPRKIWSTKANSWTYVFPKRDKYFGEMMEVYGVSPDKNLSSEKNFVCPTEHSGIEAAFYIDSFAAMLTERDEEEGERSKIRAGEAQAFSNHLKRVVAKISNRGCLLFGINQHRKVPGQVYGPAHYAPGGEALKLYSAQRAEMVSRGSGFHPGIASYNKDVKAIIEKSVLAKGYDRYDYKAITNTKNKMGNPNKQTWIRIWKADAKGTAHGIDPAFDLFWYLKETGQIKSGKRSKGVLYYTFKLRNSVGKNRADLLNALPPFSELALKALTLSEVFQVRELRDRALKGMGLSKPVGLRAALFKQVQTDDEVRALSNGTEKSEADEVDYEADGREEL